MRSNENGRHNGYRNAGKQGTKHRNCGLAVLLAVVMLVVALLSGCGQGPSQAIQSTQDSQQSGGEGKIEDTTPPTLEGVKDLSVYMGDAVAYLSGVSASDDTDPTPVISVDSSAVDLSAMGKYKVTYTATDAAGNTSSVTVTVSVYEKPAEIVPLETIYAAVDARLARIIPKNATKEQQVQAIYEWIRANYPYGPNTVRADYRQAAYEMLTRREGDCYGFFSLTKLMFERLDIPNIDVRKVKNHPADTDHFWSMVSVDGGKTWYHFDATSRQGEGDDFCLVTDAFLDAYSQSHNGSHNRDKSLYPATP